MLRTIVLLLCIALLSGCGAGKFQLSKQEYQAEVQVLGVLPLLIDRTAPLDYPYREGLYDLLARNNQGKHEQLVARLKQKKGYFDVRSLPGSADLLASSLLAGVQPVDATGRPQGFVFNAGAVAELTEQNVVDALLVVVFAGAQVEETRRSRNMIESLQTGYSDLLATAAVVGRGGQVLWQLNGPDSYQAAVLQYADFDEAYYNHSDYVRLKNIPLSGVEAVFADPSAGGGKGQLPVMYEQLFKLVGSGISPGLFGHLQ